MPRRPELRGARSPPAASLAASSRSAPPLPPLIGGGGGGGRVGPGRARPGAGSAGLRPGRVGVVAATPAQFSGRPHRRPGPCDARLAASGARRGAWGLGGVRAAAGGAGRAEPAGCGRLRAGSRGQPCPGNARPLSALRASEPGPRAPLGARLSRRVRARVGPHGTRAGCGEPGELRGCDAALPRPSGRLCVLASAKPGLQTPISGVSRSLRESQRKKLIPGFLTGLAIYISFFGVWLAVYTFQHLHNII